MTQLGELGIDRKWVTVVSFPAVLCKQIVIKLLGVNFNLNEAFGKSLECVLSHA